MALAAVAACASAPAYVRAAGPNTAGYSEQQIESNRFYVTYRAPGGADQQLVEDYALLRAADLTLQQGRDWFIVDRRVADQSMVDRGPSVGVGVGGASYGGHSSTGVGVGFSIPLGHHGPTATAATLEIRTGAGAKPEDANAYDARETSANLSARLLHSR
ncbi:MAG TPA: hypothetical protein VG841_15105, partial [Caulobacterales bacterium]|nr:hypothetical protein [Caulobacterales bacterium]